MRDPANKWIVLAILLPLSGLLGVPMWLWMPPYFVCLSIYLWHLGREVRAAWRERGWRR